MVARKKVKVLDNACGVGIIYRASNPRQVFLEMKDDGYPRKAFHRMGCLMGGNWVGEAAKNDHFPIDTFRREVSEELSFEKAIADPVEMKQLHGITTFDSSENHSSSIPSEKDIETLKEISREIQGRALPHRVYRVFVPRRVFVGQEEKYSDWRGLVCVFEVPLPDYVWNKLAYLLNKFSNLSNESITIMTSLEEIVDTGFQISWGHDQVLRRFFLDNGFEEARKMAMVPGITTRYLGGPANSYKAYLERFKFLVCPFEER